jgi:uncharacterized protein YegL
MTETIAGKNPAAPLHVVIVLDRSGSMGQIRQSAISGFNAFLNRQRKEPGTETTFFSLYIFADEAERLWSNVPVDRVSNLTPETYQPDGNTALLDAIGTAIRETEQRQEGMVLVVVLTDGEENASRHFGLVTVRDLVRQKIESNWEFIWLGSDGRSKQFAIGLGIPTENIELFKVTDEGIQDSYDKISDSVSLKKQSGSTKGWKGDDSVTAAPGTNQAPGKKHSKKP